jgi:hypothetical protein
MFHTFQKHSSGLIALAGIAIGLLCQPRYGTISHSFRRKRTLMLNNGNTDIMDRELPLENLLCSACKS